ncbi:type II toxin-antitoxin system VapC family toxin [Oscillatoria amoena NRMC-F 0135]|nr:type II toxin-antitoxin system VapC family toxin [Oscillatoria laete-virens]MDL5046567.1 type II toxin-antitoxin system VapC family toxin [Oscillatoria amoena NRMC-F 0135]MDL5053557.1 type II toxin-antitoxin system VapC family toxin [Oscillatoria laete-virens NRMC-F 0139]
MLYFDTSYLVRLYLQDRGFELVRALASKESIASSRHGKSELTGALHRAYREKRFSRGVYEEVLRQVSEDFQSGGITLLEMTEGVFECVESRFGWIPRETFLRTADALHLACASIHGFKEIYSHDQHLLQAASLFGLIPRNVIVEEGM